MTKMYLDDERDPKTPGPWVIVRSVDNAIRHVVENGIPSYISFDHDLGEDVLTGYDFAKWLVDQELLGAHFFPENFEYNVHSANPVGAENIRAYLDGYFKQREDFTGT